ncbi:MAG TPA: restriction endonuclease [Solirubrobacterales bacterium]
MAVPDFQTIMRPLLVLHADGQEHEVAATRNGVADHFDLSPEDRAERIPSGRVTTLQNRVGWAAMYLFRAGLLERPRRAHYRITERGREVLKQHPQRIDLSVLKQFEEFEEFRKAGKSPAAEKTSVPVTAEAETAVERIDAGYQELRSALIADLIDRVREEDWDFFERLVLKVLRSMGYGGLEGAIERLGGHGSDGGVDGVIREDPLGLELIYIQAKAWQDKTVGRPEIQQFIGALHGRQASKGVFLTTSKFSPEAQDYAAGVSSRVILIDGPRLAELMIDHNVGVTTRDAYEIKEVDLSYFAPEEAGS